MKNSKSSRSVPQVKPATEDNAVTFGLTFGADRANATSGADRVNAIAPANECRMKNSKSSGSVPQVRPATEDNAVTFGLTFGADRANATSGATSGADRANPIAPA